MSANTVPRSSKCLGLRVLFAGQLSRGSTSLQRLVAMQRLGITVCGVDLSPSIGSGVRSAMDALVRRGFWAGFPMQAPRDWHRLNQRVIAAAEAFKPDLVWIEKGTVFRRETYLAIRAASRLKLLIGYSLDDMGSRHNQTQRFLESLDCYDYFITTKSYGVEELKALGAQGVVFVNNAFDPIDHRPPRMGECPQFDVAFGFIGAFESDRYEAIRALAEAEHSVRVVGIGRWPWYGKRGSLEIVRGPVLANDYARAIWSTQVNLGFLRKCNRDLQTTRSVEIPACGGFMLAERTDEHCALFREGTEADYFSSTGELLEKASRYKSRPDLCRQIGAAARARCEQGGYSYDDQIQGILDRVPFHRNR